MSTEESEFQKLLSCCEEIAILFPDGVVFIGGIAIYLHTINEDKISAFAEFTHDADFYISIADMADLRDMEEVTPNRRLNKHQIIKSGFEFDIYTERYSSLIVPYDAVKAHSILCDKIPLACLEHLLVLKAEALLDRKNSSKGGKDIKDIFRITQVAHCRKKKLRLDMVEGYLNREHLSLLRSLEKSSEALALAKGNSKLAKSIREVYSHEIRNLIKGH